ncbi:MAG TPA: MFS transporter [Xanthobacteraceae bacterium]|jgi:predicted MFS family arabinose efflux permease|nr:MFS transporter [Xanthobacteraceae bacterium]
MTPHAVSPSKGSYRWLVLAAATLAQATASFAMLGVAALAGFLQQDFQLTAAETGLLITATYGAAVFSLLFVGDLLDRKSERLIIGIGGAIAFIALMAATRSGNFAVLLLCLFVAGLGFSVTQPGGSKSVSAWFRGDRLGLAMGIRQAGLPFGGALAAAILPAVAAAVSWRAAFAAGAVATLGGAFVFALVYRPPADGADAASKRAALSYAAVAGLLRQSWMRNAMIAGLALVSAQYAILTWLMLYLRDHAHIALTRGAWFLALAQAAGVAGRVGLAAWSDRTPARRFRLLSVCMIAVAGGFVVLLLASPQTPEPALALLAAWLGFFGLGWYGPWVAYLADTATADQVGLTLGAAMAINQLGIIGAPPLLGLVHDLTGGYTALWACAVGVLAVAYALTGVRRER